MYAPGYTPTETSFNPPTTVREAWNRLLEARDTTLLIRHRNGRIEVRSRTDEHRWYPIRWLIDNYTLAVRCSCPAEAKGNRLCCHADAVRVYQENKGHEIREVVRWTDNSVARSMLAPAESAA